MIWVTGSPVTLESPVPGDTRATPIVIIRPITGETARRVILSGPEFSEIVSPDEVIRRFKFKGPTIDYMTMLFRPQVLGTLKKTPRNDPGDLETPNFVERLFTIYQNW